MLRDILPVKIPITLCGKEMYLRYTLNSQLYLEHYYGDVDLFLDKNTDDWTAKDALHMLRAGLMDCFHEENESTISALDFDNIKPSLAGVGRMIDMTGLRDITALVVQAIIASLPTPVEGERPNFTESGAG